jgi:MFS family permease
VSICAPRQGAALEDGVRENGNTAILALLSFAMLLVSLDQYIVVVAPPEIGRDLGYSAHTLQLLVSAYGVASSGFLLFGGRSRETVEIWHSLCPVISGIRARLADTKSGLPYPNH